MPSSKPSSRDRDGRRSAAFVMGETIAALALTFALTTSAVLRGAASVAGPQPLPSDSSTVWTFLAAFAAVTVIIVLLLRTMRGSRVFEAVFLIAIFTGIGTLFADLFGPEVAVLGTAGAVLLYYGARSVLVFDLLLVLGSAGVAANLGVSMRPIGVAVILAILAGYDIVAVYVTKHMVQMAESMLRRRVFFAMILPERPAGFLLPVAEAVPGSGFIFLGTGDVILPALLVASVCQVSIVAAAIVAAGALAGAAALHLLFLTQKVRKPMPALPPIAAGALLGLVITFFLPL